MGSKSIEVVVCLFVCLVYFSVSTDILRYFNIILWGVCVCVCVCVLLCFVFVLFVCLFVCLVFHDDSAIIMIVVVFPIQLLTKKKKENLLLLLPFAAHCFHKILLSYSSYQCDACHSNVSLIFDQSNNKF